MRNHVLVAALAGLALAGAASAQITTTPDNNPLTLAAAIQGAGTGINVSGIAVSSQSAFAGAAKSVGTYFALPANNYGMFGRGLVLSTGDVGAYSSGPNTRTNYSLNYANPVAGGAGGAGAGVPATAAQNGLLTPITGQANHFDVTQIDVTFTADPGVDRVGFDLVFGSDEFAEFVNSIYNDGFGIYLNGVNIAFLGGLPININHPAVAPVPETELDGVITLAPGNSVFQVSGPVIAGTNTLTFILGDSSDGIYDTTVYIQNLGVPAPSAGALAGLAGLMAARRRRR